MIFKSNPRPFRVRCAPQSHPSTKAAIENLDLLEAPISHKLSSCVFGSLLVGTAAVNNKQFIPGEVYGFPNDWSPGKIGRAFDMFHTENPLVLSIHYRDIAPFVYQLFQFLGCNQLLIRRLQITPKAEGIVAVLAKNGILGRSVVRMIIL